MPAASASRDPAVGASRCEKALIHSRADVLKKHFSRSIRTPAVTGQGLSDPGERRFMRAVIRVVPREAFSSLSKSLLARGFFSEQGAR